MDSISQAMSMQFIERVPHMRAIGVRIDDVAKARGTMTLPASPDWLGDPVRGLIHPGALTVLADSACGLAVGAALEKPAPFATLDLRMDYLRSAGPEHDVHCEAECFRLSRNVAFTRASLWQGNRDEPIAVAQATFMLATPAGTRPKTPTGISDPLEARQPTASESAARPWQPPSNSEPVAFDRPVPYVDFLGIRMTPDGNQTLLRLPYQEKLIGNPRLPALHGGVVAGFSETAAILHLIVNLKGAKFPKGIDFSIDYLRAGRPEETFAQCEIVRVGSRVALVQVRCWQKSPDYPITTARGHFLLTDREAGA
jgi:uncharacterized protein (TIGR00369 family)